MIVGRVPGRSVLVPRRFAVPIVQPKSCPIRASLGALGRKWALLLLRDIAFHENVRFSDMLRNSPGLTPRILSIRLKELQQEGFIERVARAAGNGSITYELTPKGQDTVPVLTAFVNFGMKRHADVVFKDGKARSLTEMFPNSHRELLGDLKNYADSSPRINKLTPRTRIPFA